MACRLRRTRRSVRGSANRTVDQVDLQPHSAPVGPANLLHRPRSERVISFVRAQILWLVVKLSTATFPSDRRRPLHLSMVGISGGCTIAAVSLASTRAFPPNELKRRLGDSCEETFRKFSWLRYAGDW